MKNFLRTAAFLAALIVAQPALAAVGVIYMDTAANGSASASFSGTTDTTTPALSGTAATLVSGTAAVTLDTNTNISTVPGCSAGTCDGSQAIFITNATNSNQKIFWISSYTGCTGTGACVLTVSVNVTCATCTAQAWAIGGRMILTPANYESALRPGDTVLFNISPASSALALVAFRVSGDATTGFIYLKGKSGVRPQLTVTANSAVLNPAAVNNWWIENLELISSGTGGLTATASGANIVYYNVKFTHTSGGGSTAHIIMSGNSSVLNSEFNITSGTGNDISVGTNATIEGNYFHGSGGDAVNVSQVQPGTKIINNIFSSNVRGVNLSGTSTSQVNGAVIYGNTFYANTTAGLEVANANSVVALFNNIFVNDGTHANVIWDAGNAQLVSIHFYNVFYASGGTNVTGLTPNATELTTNPLLNNPAGGDFSLQSTSPAKAAGFPGTMLGGSTVGYMDIGAIQLQATTGGGATGAIRPGIGQ